MFSWIILRSREADAFGHLFAELVFNPHEEIVEPIKPFSPALNKQWKWQAGTDKNG